MTGTCLENKSNSVSFLDSQVIPPKTNPFQVLSYFQVLNAKCIWHIYIYYLSTLSMLTVLSSYSHIFSSTLSVAQMSKLCSTAVDHTEKTSVYWLANRIPNTLAQSPIFLYICIVIYIYNYIYILIYSYWYIYIYIYWYICVYVYIDIDIDIYIYWYWYIYICIPIIYYRYIYLYKNYIRGWPCQQSLCQVAALVTGTAASVTGTGSVGTPCGQCWTTAMFL